MKKTWKILIYDGNDGQFEAGLGPWENMGDCFFAKEEFRLTVKQ